ncbi:MAG TPA: isoprenylcysteine carboxylmethyltransferase family protein [Anaerolineales bacterium]
MNTQSKNPSVDNRSEIATGILKRFGQVASALVFQGIILFLSAGSLNWLWAWIFLGIYLVSVLINSVFLMRTSPETVAERGQPKEMKRWDMIVSGIWALTQYLFLPLVAGLDYRFHWILMLSSWNIIGAAIFAIGLGIFSWAMITNTYFSTAVRIQNDRGQTVCRSGPYHFVRHPGYVGAMLQSLGIPILLGSLWALIPGVIAVTAMIVRTDMEDHTLQAELTGYKEFAQEIRYRLVPGIW